VQGRFRFLKKCNIGRVIRIAAAGDVHASEATRDRVLSAFERVADEADVVLLAGDLTTTGEPEQAAVLAEACRDLPIPVFTVFGNHDVHAGKQDDIKALVRAGHSGKPVDRARLADPDVALADLLT